MNLTEGKGEFVYKSNLYFPIVSMHVQLSIDVPVYCTLYSMSSCPQMCVRVVRSIACLDVYCMSSIMYLLSYDSASQVFVAVKPINFALPVKKITFDFKEMFKDFMNTYKHVQLYMIIPNHVINIYVTCTLFSCQLQLCQYSFVLYSPDTSLSPCQTSHHVKLVSMPNFLSGYIAFLLIFLEQNG